MADPELDYQMLMAAQNANANYRDIEPEFHTVLNACRRYTMTSVERMYALYKATQHLARTKTPGAFVECGVWRGGSCMVMAHTLLEAETERDIWLFDTFEGHTQEPDEFRDVDIFGGSGFQEYRQREAEGTLKGWGAASSEDVFANMLSTGYPMGYVHMIKGPLEETAGMYDGGDIALLRIDMDWYAPAKVAFDVLFPRLVRGGVLIMDDYGHYKGQRQATDEALVDCPMLLHRIDYSGRMGIKP